MHRHIANPKPSQDQLMLIKLVDEFSEERGRRGEKVSCPTKIEGIEIIGLKAGADCDSTTFIIINQREYFILSSEFAHKEWENSQIYNLC